MNNELIKSCTATYTAPYIQFSILTQKIENYKFAFYVYLNNKKVHVEWYSEKNTFSFDTKNINGFYRIIGFCKGEDIIESIPSQYLFLNEKDCSISELSEPGPYHFYEEWEYPILYFPHTNPILFVLLPSAITKRKECILPVFHRWSWAMQGIFPGHVICISDPTLMLHPDLQIGWCIGNAEHNATRKIATYISKVADQKNIPNENIIFYGSSAGGFAALALSAIIEGSTAIAINAQTNILRYAAQKHVALFQKVYFGKNAMKTSEIDFNERTNMVLRWKSVEKSKVFLVQNIKDFHHFEEHFKPFWESLEGRMDGRMNGIYHLGRHIAWVYEHEGGHIPETKEMANTIIANLNLKYY